MADIEQRYYVSFAGGGHFLGAVLVIAPHARAAIEKINALGINPGGEALVLPNGFPDCALLHVNRLLMSKEEIARVFGDDGPGLEVGEMSEDLAKLVEQKSEIVCDDCNPGRRSN